MITVELDNFSLKEICQSGQCFRMYETEENTYELIAGDKYLKMTQEGSIVNFYCSDMEFICYWVPYFDIDADYSSYIAKINPRDTYLMAAAECGNGIRILQQDLWEMIITFIISQQQTIPSIRRRVEDLSHAYGSRLPVPGTFYSFPSPEQLSAASLEDLLAMMLGYRAKYIKRACEDACSGRLDRSYLGSLSYEDAMDYLTGFYGIGEKVANCICLFGLHHIDAFPVDTWIEQILTKEYLPKHPIRYRRLPKSRLYTTIIQDFFGSYKGYAGVMQQYIFYYERSIRNGKS